MLAHFTIYGYSVIYMRHYLFNMTINTNGKLRFCMYF